MHSTSSSYQQSHLHPFHRLSTRELYANIRQAADRHGVGGYLPPELHKLNETGNGASSSDAFSTDSTNTLGGRNTNNTWGGRGSDARSSHIGTDSPSGLIGIILWIILPFLELVMAAAVAGIYGVNLHFFAEHHFIADSEWVYAEVCAGASLVTVLLHQLPYRMLPVNWVRACYWILW